MKKLVRLISCGAVMVFMIASIQICAMAADVASTASVPGESRTDIVSGASSLAGESRAEIVSGASRLNDIAPYSGAADTTGTRNPNTGAQSLAIPGAVAIIAAATAAVTLAGKKK